MVGLVRVIKMGAFASIDVLFVGPLPRAGKFRLWTLLCVWMEFHNSEGSIASMCVSSICKRGMGFPFLSSQTKPSEEM